MTRTFSSSRARCAQSMVHCGRDQGGPGRGGKGGVIGSPCSRLVWRFDGCVRVSRHVCAGRGHAGWRRADLRAATRAMGKRCPGRSPRPCNTRHHGPCMPKKRGRRGRNAHPAQNEPLSGRALDPARAAGGPGPRPQSGSDPRRRASPGCHGQQPCFTMASRDGTRQRAVCTYIGAEPAATTCTAIMYSKHTT